MTKKFFAGLRPLQFILLLTIIALLAALAVPKVRAAENFQPNYYANVLTNPVIIPPGVGFTLTNSGPFTLRQGRGLAVFPYMVGSNASTTQNMVLGAEVTADGVNWTSTRPYSTTNTVNGTTPTRAFFLFSAAQLNNCRQIRFNYAWNTNATLCVISNLVLSQDNQ